MRLLQFLFALFYLAYPEQVMTPTYVCADTRSDALRIGQLPRCATERLRHRRIFWIDCLQYTTQHHICIGAPELIGLMAGLQRLINIAACRCEVLRLELDSCQRAGGCRDHVRLLAQTVSIYRLGRRFFAGGPGSKDSFQVGAGSLDIAQHL